MHKKGLFVTGTDTGIGKTVVSALLVSALRDQGFEARYFKPVQTGLDSDTRAVADWLGLASHDMLAPAYSFDLPAAPSRAAAAMGSEIHISHLVESWAQLGKGHWVLEGAGGILVPLNARATNRDLVRALGLPMLVVTSTRLGTINHTLLTIEAAQREQIGVVGLALVGIPDPGLKELLETWSGVPVLAEVPALDLEEVGVIQKNGKQVFPMDVLRRMYG